MNSRNLKSILVNNLLLMLLCLLFILQTKAQKTDELSSLFESFKTASKASCGERGEAIRLGRKIIADFSDDNFNVEVIKFVKNKVNILVEEDRVCARNYSYNKYYRAKNWKEFFSTSKRIVTEEREDGLALDVILDIVSIGFNIAAVDKYDSYNLDTLFYTDLAIQRIEAGQKSKTGNWGVFEPFKNKDEALGWMNYIKGWFLFEKFDRKKEGLIYMYKSTQIGREKRDDVLIYVRIGSYYFDQLGSFPEDYLDKTTEEMNYLTALENDAADRAIVAYSKARKIVMSGNRYKGLTEILNKNISIIYKYRFNLSSVNYQYDVDKYIEKLMVRPMPDPSKPLEPARDEPIGIEYKRN